jgi:hypothetical protein
MSMPTRPPRGQRVPHRGAPRARDNSGALSPWAWGAIGVLFGAVLLLGGNEVRELVAGETAARSDSVPRSGPADAYSPRTPELSATPRSSMDLGVTSRGRASAP